MLAPLTSPAAQIHHISFHRNLYASRRAKTMNALAQEQLQRQAESIPLLKREIEREFYASIKFCNCCQRPGEWKKKCGRCKEAYYCSRECQRWAWPVHKQHCYAPGAERPSATAEEARSEKPDVVREEQVDLTDKALARFFSRAVGVLMRRRRSVGERLPETFERAFVTGATGSTGGPRGPGQETFGEGGRPHFSCRQGVL